MALHSWPSLASQQFAIVASALLAIVAPALLALAVLSAASSGALAQEAVLVQFGTAMRYLANGSNPGIGMAWTAEGFVDSAWASGSYGVGYETTPPGAQNLLQTTVPSGTYSVYTRARFTLVDATSVRSLFLGVDYDDGYVAWINGVEVYRSAQMPAGALSWNTIAASHESSNGQVPNYNPLQNISASGIPALHDGENVLAIGVWNVAATSSDLVLVPRLSLDKDPAVSRGPYLQMGTPTGIVVRWRTDVATDGVVRYGSAPGNLTSTQTAPALTTEHIVTLSGLQAETRYYYSVGTSAAPLEGGDGDHFFVTSPPPGVARTMRAWVLGDSGTANANAQAVRDAYDAFTGAVPTDFWLMLGDNAYPDGTDSDYQAAVFDMYPEMLRRSVLWPTFGNHDGHSADSSTQTGPYYDMFSLPSAAQAGGVPSGTEAYYSFDRGNVHFICLDSYESSRAPGGAMLVWLQQDLAATTKDWIVAFWHHPPYSKGSHDSDAEIELIEMRQNALPILEAYGVDLVLTGHSHSYERSFLIDGHYGSSSTFSDANKINGGSGRIGSGGPYQKPQIGPGAHEGAVYAVAGSSGQTSGGALNHPAMYVSLNLLGSMVLDFEGNRLDATFLDSDGAVRDWFTMTKGPELRPAADFLGTVTTGAAPLNVGFIDRSTNGPTSWAWDLDGDGTTDAAAQNPSKVYASPGLYSVRLTASNGAGSDQEIRPGYICATTGAAAPIVNGLQLASDRRTLNWNPQATGTSYDVVKGDLVLLASSGGNFTTSLVACLQNDGAATSADDAQTPAAGRGFYYLVRATDCAHSAGSYDSGNPGQVGSRDAEIQAAAVACQ